MKITNEIYTNLNLANENDRGDNLIIDFVISSLLGVLVAWLTFYDLISAIAVYYIVRFFYYFIFEMYTGRTLGKYQTQTMVIDKDGYIPSKIQLIIRTLSRFVSVFSGISDDEKAIHDYTSNTFVIKDKKLKKIEFKQPLIFLFHQTILVYFAYYFYDKPRQAFIDVFVLVLLILAILSGFVMIFRKLSRNSSTDNSAN
ncbi:RDD family protein [uncultured Winogradskyella sp.]|uniref:RDD family protein n=1 Tax=uncultured Winogradskyella sp. TaxID=395353 RepID=UPI002636A0A3|nr:RDD family protein [uncultured Winogradskyella sp.]